MYGAEHVQRYEETDGEVGYDWGDHGAHILVLTTVGRKSGEERKHALIFREVDGGYAIVASNGGAKADPAWYLNLQADPAVKVQVKADRFAAHARTATDEEQARIWPLMTEVWPDYDTYTTRTDRPIRIVVLERA
ncbi:deazaflavin-dependent oxidoreductase (nitroreductase family) [Kribbella amoyensis]|uniref:Deazaflavin-dependent oxidoreductase (Nitroreductase family) n=1 Tax=Kribbella amoyensis TaxID=996641 RepID=A0A561BJY0_9ACTN|nr:nitroreductase family deazaflavin-dependent oxidoreductase [Kribbella amoyensis]TWD79145.1 deazaflavin-dependent oxidoreductase (nitroreductase family) [Kribbella amoyensis]